MKWVWTPLCFTAAWIEYQFPNICGNTVLGAMWLMWLVMGVIHSDVYVRKIKEKLNGSHN